VKMLKKAENQTAFGKVGIYGDAGSGKTFTASCMAIGLHKFAKCTKPIAFFDTEPALSYVLPLFKAAGIEVLSCESRALSDLMAFMEEAEQHCSIVIIDSISHPWRDIQKSYIDKVNADRKKRNQSPKQKLEFHDWGPIKDRWGKFTDKFLSSKVHVILCGRMSSIYEYQTNDQGKKELITNGTKMATEKELGYEPSLLIEMIKHREHGKITNRALIEKDRFNFLNGEEIDFTPHKGVDMKNIMDVFERVKPHFSHLNLSGTHFDSLNQRDSKDMYPDMEHDDWPSEQRQRIIWSEEIDALMEKYHPGQTAQAKKARADLVEKFFNTGSWTKVSEHTSSQKLKETHHSMKQFLEGGEDEPLEVISQEQADRLKDLLKDKEDRLIKMLEWANVKTIEEMPVVHYNIAIDKLRLEQGEPAKEEQKAA
jgi:hypothetical protein